MAQDAWIAKVASAVQQFRMQHQQRVDRIDGVLVERDAEEEGHQVRQQAGHEVLEGIDGDARPRSRRPEGVVERVRDGVDLLLMQNPAVQDVEYGVPQEEIHRDGDDSPDIAVVKYAVIEMHSSCISVNIVGVMHELDNRGTRNQGNQPETEIRSQ